VYISRTLTVRATTCFHQAKSFFQIFKRRNRIKGPCNSIYKLRPGSNSELVKGHCCSNFKNILYFMLLLHYYYSTVNTGSSNGLKIIVVVHSPSSPGNIKVQVTTTNGNYLYYNYNPFGHLENRLAPID
jgi:hypothetical protein